MEPSSAPVVSEELSLVVVVLVEVVVPGSTGPVVVLVVEDEDEDEDDEVVGSSVVVEVEDDVVVVGLELEEVEDPEDDEDVSDVSDGIGPQAVTRQASETEATELLRGIVGRWYWPARSDRDSNRIAGSRAPWGVGDGRPSWYGAPNVPAPRKSMRRPSVDRLDAQVIAGGAANSKLSARAAHCELQ